MSLYGQIKTEFKDLKFSWYFLKLGAEFEESHKEVKRDQPVKNQQLTKDLLPKPVPAPTE